MRYISPNINLIQVQHLIQNQGSGTPVIPLNPDCTADNCATNGTGALCGQANIGINQIVHYFVPQIDCEDSTPCTVKVAGNILSCNVASTCIPTTCNNQPGAVIICSGLLPAVQSCQDLDSNDIVVECTSPTDSDICPLV